MSGKLAVLMALCLPLLAEPRWAASISDQGAAVKRGALGRRAPKEITVYTATVCSGDAAISLSEAAMLREFHARGVVVFSRKSLDPLLVNVDARSWRSIIADTGEALTLGGAVITSAGVIQIKEPARQRFAFGLALAAGVMHFLHGKAAGATLDPNKIAGFVLPDPANLAAHQDCWTGDLLGVKGPVVPYFEVK